MKLLSRKPKEANRRSSVLTPRGRGVFSYYANRPADAPDTSRVGRNKPSTTGHTSRWLYLPSFMAALALIISFGYILTLDTNPKISLTGNASGLSVQTSATYQQAARTILARSIFNHNKLTVDTGAVERGLKQQFPELSEVAVTLPLLGHRPVIELVAVQPALVLVTKGNLAVVASNGKVLAAGKSLNNSALKDLPRVDDNSGLSLQIGAAVLPSAQVSFIQNLVAQITLQQLSVQSLSLPAAPNEVDIHLSGISYFLKFNTDLDVRQQVGTYLAAKQKLDGDHITPAEYIDLRVEEKIFYK